MILNCGGSVIFAAAEVVASAVAETVLLELEVAIGSKEVQAAFHGNSRSNQYRALNGPLLTLHASKANHAARGPMLPCSRAVTITAFLSSWFYTHQLFQQNSIPRNSQLGTEFRSPGPSI
jgi:hypothetical protein